MALELWKSSKVLSHLDMVMETWKLKDKYKIFFFWSSDWFTWRHLRPNTDVLSNTSLIPRLTQKQGYNWTREQEIIKKLNSKVH